MTTELENLLGAEGLDLCPTPMQWMVLTWDVAAVNATTNLFLRVFLTRHSTVLAGGTLSPRHFDDLNPVLGDDVRLMREGVDPLLCAETATDRALSSGYQLLCRPLAVDCSALAGTILADGSGFAEPAGLLGCFGQKTMERTLLLRQLNDARAAAVDTHIAPGWWDAFGLERDVLWEGRG